MSLLLIDGFDSGGSDETYFLNRWEYSGTFTHSTAYARLDGEGLLCSSYTSYLTHTFAANESTIAFGLALYFGSTPAVNTSYPLIRLLDAGTTQVALYLDSAFCIAAYRGPGSVLLGTSTAAFTSTQQWRYIEGKVVINDSSGSVELRSNGSTILNLTGQDTQNTANAYCTAFQLRGIYNAVYGYYDDLYIDDADFHGDCVVHTFRPDADGVHTDFTASAGNRYECVDEQEHNADTDYIYSSTATDKYTYGITTGALNTVEGIQHTLFHKKDDAGSRQIKGIVRSNGSDYQGSTVEVDTNYRQSFDLYESDPDDSNPWTQAKLEAAEFGVEITA